MKKSTFGLNQPVAIGLAYILTPISSIIFLINEKEDKQLRFHAMQSLIIGIAALAIQVIAGIVGIVPLLGGIIGWVLHSIGGLVWLASFILAIMAFTGSYHRLPIIADIADSKI